jgi:hypothetical protein
MSSAGASAGDRHAGLRAARVPAGLGAAPNSSTQSMGDPPAVANGRGNRRYRGHGRRADAGARIAAICYGEEGMGDRLKEKVVCASVPNGTADVRRIRQLPNGLCQVCVLGTSNRCIMGRHCQGIETSSLTRFPARIV